MNDVLQILLGFAAIIFATFAGIALIGFTTRLRR